MTYRLSADVGGTFTDLVLLDEDTGAYRATKVPTTGQDIAVGVVQGFDDLTGGDYSAVSGIVYGTTAGLNAVIQRTGARTALVTTRGFRDVYEIARSNHPAMYDNQYRKPTPLIGRSDVIELDERTDAAGRVVLPVDEQQLRDLAATLAGYESVAVVLLHAYRNAGNERAVAAVLRTLLPELPVSLSSEVAPELGEYERTSTTVLNAAMAPIIARYVTRLRGLLTARGFTGGVYVMQSNGGVLTERVAAAQPVRIVMSGPVGGVIGAGVVGAGLGVTDVIAVDMGGTSFDVSVLVDGAPQVGLESELEGFPVLTPSVQTLSVGAGGGSVAWTEAGGMRVGPRSAGARPGPVSYGHGGLEPTTTDAQVVLGRIAPDRFLGGRMTLHPDLAADALGAYGDGLGLSTEEAARGVVTIATTTMADAIRQITLRRGLDARDFTLFAYGGAGPLVAVDLAEELGIARVLVPPRPGAFSAWGMLHAALRCDGVHPVLRPLAGITPADLDAAAATVRAGLDPGLVAAIEAEGGPVEERSLDLRYDGQKYTVNLPWQGPGDAAAIRAAFDARYRVLFGFSSPQTAVELVNVRVALAARARRPSVPDRVSVVPGAAPERRADGTLVGERGSLPVGTRLSGPAVLGELTATTYVPVGWQVTVEPDGSLSIVREGSA